MTWQHFELGGNTRYDPRVCDRLQYEVGSMAELLALRALPIAVRNGGVVPLNALADIKRDIPRVKDRVAELVAAEIWTEVDWGWRMFVGGSTHCRRRPDDRCRLTSELRAAVLEHDDYRCQACGSSDRLVIDHIVPVARGGKTVFENLQALCAWCNGSKGTRTWEEFIGGRA